MSGGHAYLRTRQDSIMVKNTDINIRGGGVELDSNLYSVSLLSFLSESM